MTRIASRRPVCVGKMRQPLEFVEVGISASVSPARINRHTLSTTSRRFSRRPRLMRPMSASSDLLTNSSTRASPARISYISTSLSRRLPRWRTRACRSPRSTVAVVVARNLPVIGNGRIAAVMHSILPFIDKSSKWGLTLLSLVGCAIRTSTKCHAKRGALRFDRGSVRMES